MRTRLAIPTFVALLLVGTRAAAAEPTACELPEGARMSVVRYVDGVAKGSPLCDGGGKTCRLSGWLYRPAGKGPFPTLVLSHSAEGPRAEGTYCELTEHFVAKGYLVFQPVRRGYRGDAGLGQNTGELPATTLAALADGKPAKSAIATELAAACGRLDAAKRRDCMDARLQASQVLELRAAIAALAQHSADTSRIAVMGHGEGANITAMLAAEQTKGVRAGVLVSAVDSKWAREHVALAGAVRSAVEQRTFPLAFLQPRDADDVASTVALADAAVGSKDGQLMASLLPPVGGGATAAQVRKRFATSAKHVARWAPLAHDFFVARGVGARRGEQEQPRDDGEHETKCDRLVPGTKVTAERYYDPKVRSLADPLCNAGKDGGVDCNLKGILYVPPDARDAPAVVLSYGGDAKVRGEGGFCMATEYFNRHGFVVFLPRRRGTTQREHDHPEDHFHFRSTGVAMADTIAATETNLAASKPLPPEAQPYAAVCHLVPGASKEDIRCLGGELMRAEAKEIGLAVKWLRTKSALVDPHAVVAIGHSNGGQVVLHAAARLAGAELPDAVVAISPLEQGWGHNPHKQAILERSVRDAKVPLAILRPANASNLGSTELLGKIAATERKRFLTEVYPAMAVPPGTEDVGGYVHNAFIHERATVTEWGATTRRFIAAFVED